MLWYAAIASSSWDPLQCSLHGAGWRHLLMVCTLICHPHVVHGQVVHGQMLLGQMLHESSVVWSNAAWSHAAWPNSVTIQRDGLLLSWSLMMTALHVTST